MAAITMDRSRPPFLFPTLPVPDHNHSGVETAAPPPSPDPLGLGEDPGWPGNRTGPRYARTPGEVAAVGVFFGTLWLTSVLGNSLVCLVIHRSRRAQSTTNYFVVSLACADLLASAAGAPLVLLQFVLGRWVLGGAACRLVRFAQYLTPGVQTSVLLCISLDRFYTVVYPLSFKVSREKARRMIAASWLLAAALASPVLFLFGPAGDGHCPHFPPASWQGRGFAALQVLAGFAVPAALLALVYRRVVGHIWRLGGGEGGGRAVRRTMNVVPRTKLLGLQARALRRLQRQLQEGRQGDLLHVGHQVLPQQRLHHHRQLPHGQEELRGHLRHPAPRQGPRQGPHLRLLRPRGQGEEAGLAHQRQPAQHLRLMPPQPRFPSLSRAGY
ncbi:putative G-protein coupled receptor 19 isoform 2-T4 [Thomomys bottae]